MKYHCIIQFTIIYCIF